MKITAVVLTYYPERAVNVERIVDDLKNGSRPPDKIIVLSNNPKVSFKDDGVTVVTSTANYSTRAKYVACLLEPSDYYILLDDDVTVGKETLAHLQSLTGENEYFCTAQSGRIFRPDRILSEATEINEREIRFPVYVDIIIGSIVFCSFKSLIRMLAAESKVRLKDKKYIFEGDDLLMGLVNRPIRIFPAIGEEQCVNLSEQEINFSKVYGNYSKMRDEFTTRMLEVLG